MQDSFGISFLPSWSFLKTLSVLAIASNLEFFRTSKNPSQSKLLNPFYLFIQLNEHTHSLTTIKVFKKETQQSQTLIFLHTAVHCIKQIIKL